MENYDYNLERHYHPENFERDDEELEEIEETLEEEKTIKMLKYSFEVRDAILEGIKI